MCKSSKNRERDSHAKENCKSLDCSIVYRDENYPTSWISEENVKIIFEDLEERGFKEKSAEELKAWMEDVIKDQIKNTVVVFAQDVVPDTVFEDIDANALIRQYLDSGGKVVWIGDMPFYYQGKEGETKVEKLQKEVDLFSWDDCHRKREYPTTTHNVPQA